MFSMLLPSFAIDENIKTNYLSCFQRMWFILDWKVSKAFVILKGRKRNSKC